MEIQMNEMTTNSSPTNSNNNPMQSWWESISKARTRIQVLSTILQTPSVSSLADSDHPARSLLESQESYSTISSFLSNPLSGSGNDPLCQWLYETYQSSDPDLRLVVLSFIPLLTGLYLSRIIYNNNNNNTAVSLSGFEAVLLALYASETKIRAGKPVLISIPDLTQPSLYHSPPNKPASTRGGAVLQTKPCVGLLCPPLEPQVAVKSTKRAFIVSVVLHCYYKHISQMPSWSKLDLCLFAAAWAGQNCICKGEFDVGCEGNGNEIKDFEEDENEIEIESVEDVVDEMRKLEAGDGCLDNGVSSKGTRIPLPLELYQPVLRIIGHCLMAPLISEDVRDCASIAVRCLYARAYHDLLPGAILPTRSLINLDKSMRLAAKAAAAANAASNANTPSKAKKPEEMQCVRLPFSISFVPSVFVLCIDLYLPSYVGKCEMCQRHILASEIRWIHKDDEVEQFDQSSMVLFYDISLDTVALEQQEPCCRII
ncbi:hypothetical protein IFM89_021974 [Coptis chinensis]|uniref:Hyccin n=1 Tax=Coptis chinensis TaxID=261450 RepID=A0A835I483_9MAGN|nr:hypothetical protein IFM89_021974 [Coptis chinensis]